MPQLHRLLCLALLATGCLANTNSTKTKESPIVGRPGWCISTYENRDEMVSSCGNIVDMTLEGRNILEASVPITAEANAQAGRTDHEKRQMSLQAYIRDFANGLPTPNCTFFKMSTTDKTECCDGYSGNNCQNIVCFVSAGGCQNGGTCVLPNVCQCAPNYMGVNCDEDINAIKTTPGQQYCYSDDTCATKKPAFGSNRVTFNVCCAGGSGSFGYQKGCMSCKAGVITKNSTVVDLVPFDTCVSFGPNSYRTMDGKTFEYQGRCSYLLAGSVNPTMKWWVQMSMVNCDKFDTCKKLVTMRFDDVNQYVAMGFNVQVYKLSSGTLVKIDDVNFAEDSDPHEWSGVKVERKGSDMYMTVRSISVKVKWDNGSSVYVTLDRALHKNQGLKGLCGDYNGNPDDDFGDTSNPAAFGNQWKSDNCPDTPNSSSHCDTPEMQAAAESDCSPINTMFFQCHRLIAPGDIFSRCVGDMCMLAKSSDSSPAAKAKVLCTHLSAYSYQCALEGVCIGWRSSTLCPQSCPSLKLWSECASVCPTTCANYDQLMSSDCEATTVPRCRCQPGYVHYNDTCVKPNECPCTYGGVEYMPGSSLVVDCSTCTCANGRWQCTYSANCPKVCSVTGSHIVTFDGAREDFNPMDCAYSLLEPQPGVDDSRAQIQVKMQPSPEFLLAVTADGQYANLPKMITVTYRGVTVQLKSVSIVIGAQAQVLVNGDDVTNALPYENPQAQIQVRQLTSFYVMVQIGNYLSVYFDGYRTVELKASKPLNQKMRGLCGNFDGKTENDFHPKGSDMLGTPVAVAQSYIIGSCAHPPSSLPTGSAGDSLTGVVDGCTQALQNSDSFKACRDSKKVDILGYFYRFCQKERASGAIPNSGELYCTAAMAAARACKSAGYQIDFSTDSALSKCYPACTTGGGYFTLCARTCRSACEDLGTTTICESGCYPGCDCRFDTQYRDAYGTCVQQPLCTCQDRINGDGKIYRAGDRKSVV